MFKKVGAIYNNFEEIVLVSGIAIMVIVIFIQIMMRHVFNSSLSWSEELARFLFIWVTWLGISYGQKRGEHIKITMVVDRLKGNVKKYVLIFSNLCTLGILLVLVVKGIAITEKMMEMAQTTPALHIPKWIQYSAVPISCTLMGIRVLKETVNLFAPNKLEEVE